MNHICHSQLPIFMTILFRVFLLLLSLGGTHFLNAQEDQPLPIAFSRNESSNGIDWIPTLLNANTAPINRMSQFNGFAFSWTPRGEQNSKSVYMDGINWQSNLSGWNSGFSYAGLYKSFRQDGNVVHDELVVSGYGNAGSTQFFSANAALFRKSFIMGTGFSNSSYIYESHVQYSTGKLKNNWFLNSNLILQETPIGMLPNGYKQVRGALISVDKLFNPEQKIGFTFLWDINSQGKVSPSVKEAYALAKQRNYNPNWGWYKGEPVYPNSKFTNAPQFSIRHEKKWGEHALLNSSVGIVGGFQKQSTLDWTNSFDPRPDYYRYLPSYAKNASLRQELVNYFEQHPSALQVNFDELEKVNQANDQQRSFYILNAQVVEMLLLRASTRFQYSINEYWKGDIGVELARDRIHYFNRLENLLGGQFFYNYNGWVNDDGIANNFQNDILHPDQKVKAGEQWGANYSLTSMHAKYWLQIFKAGPIVESSVGFHFAQDIVSRNGYNKNGLFQNASFGESEKSHFPSLGFKGQFVYKISGRYYLRSILFNQWESPNAGAVYLSPSMHAFQSPFLLPALHQGVDLSLFYRGVNLKIEMSAYWKQVKNSIEKKMFYHDRYNSFVYGIVGQMHSMYQGVEISMETKVWSLIQFELASTFGKYRISNNPLYDILLVNDLYKVESGLLYIKNMPASTSPELTHSFSIQYQPNYNFSLNFSGVYASNRFMNHDLFRRSNAVKRNASADQWQEIVAPNLLPSQFNLNGYLSKTFFLKSVNHTYSWRSSISARNILNTLIPVLAFEQSRFDYKYLQTQKYAPKYIYDQGTTYTLGLQLTIQ
jgi:hypothetical protein